jgi:hypothetical protein
VGDAEMLVVVVVVVVVVTVPVQLNTCINET